MKMTIIRVFLVALCLASSGAVPVRADFSRWQPPQTLDGPRLSGPGDPPLCYPGFPECPLKSAVLDKIADPSVASSAGSGDPPLCFPGSQGCPNGGN